jgi:hypothetical protein
MLTVEQAQSKLAETMGSGVWTMRFLNNEESSRQPIWQRYYTVGNLSDTIRIMPWNGGIMLESKRIPARFNIIDNMEELEIWIQDYQEQSSEQV